MTLTTSQRKDGTMNAKHAGRIETRELAELREKLISGPRKVRINSAILHVGKHGVLYARQGG